MNLVECLTQVFSSTHLLLSNYTTIKRKKLLKCARNDNYAKKIDEFIYFCVCYKRKFFMTMTC